MGVLRRREVTGPSVGTGVFGGYLYMSGSGMRLFGVRMPGMSPRDTDEQVMGEVTDVPPYRRAGRPQPVAVAGVEPLRDEADAAARPRAARSSPEPRREHGWRRCPTCGAAADEKLLAWLRRTRRGWRRAWTGCCQFGARARPRPAGSVPRPGGAGRAGQPDRGRHRRRRLGSDGPQLWAIGRLVAADDRCRRSSTRARRDRRAPRDNAMQPAIDAFLVEHGHRGNDEYELATPSWVMDPTPVYAAIDRLRRAPAERDRG